MTEKLSNKWWLILLVGGGLLVVSIVLYFALVESQPTAQWLSGPAPTATPLPDIEITPPASLEELAAQYPQFASILTDPELASVYKDFLLAYQQGGREAALELAREQGLLTPDEQGLRVTLVLDTEDTAALVTQLESTGVAVVSISRDRVNIAVPLSLIDAQLQSPRPAEIFEQLTELQHVIAVRLPEARVPDGSRIDGEGVGVIGADAWHDAGFTGAGIRIGVLDLGFVGYEDLLGVELPDSVTMQTFGWYDDTEVHGVACAEIVHEMAPDAELFLAWYDGSDAAMGEAVDWLMSQNVDIITHSAGWLVTPRDGTSWDSTLVDSLAEQGVLWVNSAGNEAESHYRETFHDADGDGFHDFANGENRLPVFGRDRMWVFLMWNDDWSLPTQDYELLIVDDQGNTLGTSTDLQDGHSGQEPSEAVRVQMGQKTAYLMIQAYNSDYPVTFDIFLMGPGAGFDDPVPAYSITSPGDAVGSLTVGAANWDDDSLAEYSSQGPTTDGRLKPEISAPTGVSGSTYGPHGFDGTSSSTPHVAGAAALVWQAYPELTRQELVDYLLNASRDLGPGGPDTGFGYGRLQLPAPPSGAAQPPSDRDPVPAPLFTPTPVSYTNPPETRGGSGGGSSSAAAVGLVIVVGGTGCCGSLFLGLGLLFLIVRVVGRKKPRRAVSATPAPVAPRPAPPYSAFMQTPAPPNVRPKAAEPPPSATVVSAPRDVTQAPTVIQSSRSHVDAPTVVPSTREPGLSPTVIQPRRGATPPAQEEARCPACGAPFRPGARFCHSCGQPRPDDEPTAKACPNCGHALREGAQFCPECGRPIS